MEARRKACIHDTRSIGGLPPAMTQEALEDFLQGMQVTLCILPANQDVVNVTNYSRNTLKDAIHQLLAKLQALRLHQMEGGCTNTTLDGC